MIIAAQFVTAINGRKMLIERRKIKINIDVDI